MRLKAVHLPAAAIGLEAARRAAPHGVHTIHVRAAPLAFHRVFGGRVRSRIQRGDDRLDDKVVCGTNGGYLTGLFHAPTLAGDHGRRSAWSATSGNADLMRRRALPSRICGHPPHAVARKIARKRRRTQASRQREMMAASAAATSVIVTTNEPSVIRRVISESPNYSPQPIWFATNQRAIIETGTPNNHATPYFITYSFRTIP